MGNWYLWPTIENSIQPAKEAPIDLVDEIFRPEIVEGWIKYKFEWLVKILPHMLLSYCSSKERYMRTP